MLPHVSLYDGTREDLQITMLGYEQNCQVYCASASLILWTYVPSQTDQFRYILWTIVAMSLFTIPTYIYYMNETSIKKMSAIQYHKYRDQ